MTRPTHSTSWVSSMPSPKWLSPSASLPSLHGFAASSLPISETNTLALLPILLFCFEASRVWVFWQPTSHCFSPRVCSACWYNTQCCTETIKLFSSVSFHFNSERARPACDATKEERQEEYLFNSVRVCAEGLILSTPARLSNGPIHTQHAGWVCAREYVSRSMCPHTRANLFQREEERISSRDMLEYLCTQSSVCPLHCPRTQVSRLSIS